MATETSPAIVGGAAETVGAVEQTSKAQQKKAMQERELRILITPDRHSQVFNSAHENVV